MASSPDKRWSTIVSRDHGWREFNPSHNGLGFIRNRTLFGTGDLPDLIIKQHPDIVIITLGLNDNFAFAQSADVIHTQIGADLTRLKHALPRARFIVVEPFWYTDDRPPSVDIIGGWVKAAAADIHADYIPSASHWIEHHPDWMASDGLHPNDAGYAAIANRMDAALAQLSASRRLLASQRNWRKHDHSYAARDLNSKSLHRSPQLICPSATPTNSPLSDWILVQPFPDRSPRHSCKIAWSES